MIASPEDEPLRVEWRLSDQDLERLAQRVQRYLDAGGKLSVGQTPGEMFDVARQEGLARHAAESANWPGHHNYCNEACTEHGFLLGWRAAIEMMARDADGLAKRWPPDRAGCASALRVMVERWRRVAEAA